MECKGAPETFDLQGLVAALRRLKAMQPFRWPVYDRTLHEPVEDRTPVKDEKVVVLEGNYLLLNRPGWSELADYAALTVMIRPRRREALRQRVIQRHVRGGLTREQAEQKFARSDLANILLVEEHSRPADIVLLQSAGGSYQLSSP
jgi:hypothetical protein